MNLAGYPAGYPVSGLAGYPAGYPVPLPDYPAGYRMAKKAGYPASRISGTSLVKKKFPIPIKHILTQTKFIVF